MVTASEGIPGSDADDEITDRLGKMKASDKAGTGESTAPTVTRRQSRPLSTAKSGDRKSRIITMFQSNPSEELPKFVPFRKKRIFPSTLN